MKLFKSLTFWGIVFTLLYPVILLFIELKFGSYILSLQTPFDMLKKLANAPLNNAGDFLAGIFAPLAFFWLVIGYFQNNKAISQNNKTIEQNNEAIKIQSEQLAIQTEELKNSVEEMKEANKTSGQQLQSIKANEQHARRDLFFQYYNAIIPELCVNASPILYSCSYGYRLRPDQTSNPFSKLAALNRILNDMIKSNKLFCDDKRLEKSFKEVDHYIKSYIQIFETIYVLIERQGALITFEDTELKVIVENSEYYKLYLKLRKIHRHYIQS